MKDFRTVLSVTLVLLQAAVLVQSNEKIHEYVYIENGEESAVLPCNDIVSGALSITWQLRKLGEMEFKNIFKFYHILADREPQYRNGYTANKYTIGQSVNTSLVVKTIEIADTGSYTCRSIAWDSTSYNVMLQVVVPPKNETGNSNNFYLEAWTGLPLNGPYVEGKDYTLSCCVRDILPGKNSTKFKFKYGGETRLQSGTKGVLHDRAEGDGTLSVTWRFTTSFNRTDNRKSMHCALDWGAGQYKKSGIRSSKISSVDVQFKPTELYMDIGDPVKEGTMMSVNCTTNSANPNESVTMKLLISGTQQNLTPTTSVRPGSSAGFVKTFLFHLTAEREYNSQIAKCEMSWNGNKEKEQEKRVNIMYPPKVRVEGTNSPADEYSVRNLVCHTEGGNPSGAGSYTYTWMYKPTYGEPSGTFQPCPSESDSASLLLKDLGYQEMAGTYRCTVSSIGGENSDESSLNVYYNAKSDDGPEDMTVFAAVHRDANLTVNFRINPKDSYTIEWSKGRSIVPESDLVISDQPDNKEGVKVTYRIADVNENVLGNYSVKVVNNAIQFGPKEVTFFVKLDLKDILDGSLIADQYSDVTVMSWPHITGTYSRLVLMRCAQSGENCDEIHTTTTAPSYFVLKDITPNTDVFFVIYRGNKEVLRRQFSFTDKADCLQASKTAVLGLISGLIVLTVIVCILVLGIVIYRKRQQKPENKDRPNKDNPDPLYYNSPTDMKPALYEMTKPEEPTPPSEYAELKNATYEDL